MAQFNDQVQRIDFSEKRNLEQDEILTDFGNRIWTLEKQIKNPEEEFKKLWKEIGNIWTMLETKLNIKDFYIKMEGKVDVQDFESLKVHYLQLR